MLQRDYVLELIGQFAEAVSRALKHAQQHNDRASCEEVERQIGDLLELDPATALSLAPDSLVTMMVLSGMGDSLAAYVCYSLNALSRVYAQMGESDLAGIRSLQAKAVAESFGCDPEQAPDGMEA